jgi:hypothetical protein
MHPYVLAPAARPLVRPRHRRSGRRKDISFATYHEPSVQLRQFLDGPAKIEIGEVE